jgi:SAM-dependent methyltransferase
MNWTMESLSSLATGYWGSSVLSAAVSLDLFRTVDGDGNTAEEVAALLELSDRHSLVLLNALVSLDLLKIEDGRYRIEESAVPFLSPSSPSCILGALRYNIDLYPLWGRLADCIKEGEPVIPKDAHLGNDPQKTRNFVMGMHSRALAMAPTLVPHLDMSDRKRLLDVASGPATFSRFIIEKYPDLALTAFDLPPVLAVAEELIMKTTVAERVDFHPGNYRTDNLPTGFDAVFYCGALHQENKETALQLFKKIYASLDEGGRLYVVDLMTNEAGTAPAMSVLFSLNMLLTSPFGQVFSDSDTMALLSEAGYRDLSSKDAKGSPYTIITALK